jgi:hypothetical protein
LLFERFEKGGNPPGKTHGEKTDPYDRARAPWKGAEENKAPLFGTM